MTHLQCKYSWEHTRYVHLEILRGQHCIMMVVVWVKLCLLLTFIYINHRVCTCYGHQHYISYFDHCGTGIWSIQPVLLLEVATQILDLNMYKWSPKQPPLTRLPLSRPVLYTPMNTMSIAGKELHLAHNPSHSSNLSCTSTNRYNNEWLFKLTVKPSSTCEYSFHSDSLIHFYFINCENIKAFWASWATSWLNLTGYNIAY